MDDELILVTVVVVLRVRILLPPNVVVDDNDNDDDRKPYVTQIRDADCININDDILKPTAEIEFDRLLLLFAFNMFDIDYDSRSGVIAVEIH